MADWSAAVRYAEVDQQGIVFNSHYLVYCDEALTAFCAQRGLPRLPGDVRVVTSTLTWSGPAGAGDVVEADVRCAGVGRTSITLEFALRASGRESCRVTSVYVHTDADGQPQPIDDSTRAALTA